MSFIESTIKAEHYLKGEYLMEQNAILELVEVQPRLWSVMIKDETILEVEIMNPNRNQQKSTCECEVYKKDNSCAHIAAALLYLRKQKTEQDTEKARVRKLKSRPSFNIVNILNSIDDDQLKNFVRSYAQKDKNFNVMLKATFSKSIRLENNKSKYQSILKTLVKPISTAKVVSNKANIRLAIKVAEEFLAQIEDSLSLGEYEDALDIIESTLPKLHYIYSKYEIRTKVIISLLKRFHEVIDILYQEGLAPDIVERIDAFVLDMTHQSYYNYLEEIEDLYFITLTHQRQTVAQSIVDHLGSIALQESNQVVGCAILISASRYQHVTTTEDVQLDSLKYLIRNTNMQSAISYMEYYLQSDKRNRKIENLLLEAYLKVGNKNKFESLGIRLYTELGDEHSYRMLKTVTPTDKWDKIVSIIRHKFKNNTITSSKVASFYFQEDLNIDLIEILERELDIRQLMLYDFHLYKSHYSAIERIYKSAVSKYLDSHAGRIATNYIDEIIHHLTQIRAHKLVTAIQQHIQASYPHRSSTLDFS